MKRRIFASLVAFAGRLTGPESHFRDRERAACAVPQAGSVSAGRPVDVPAAGLDGAADSCAVRAWLAQDKKVSARDQRFTRRCRCAREPSGAIGIRAALHPPQHTDIEADTDRSPDCPIHHLNRRSAMRNVLFTITLAAVGLLQLAVAVEFLGF